MVVGRCGRVGSRHGELQREHAALARREDALAAQLAVVQHHAHELEVVAHRGVQAAAAGMEHEDVVGRRGGAEQLVGRPVFRQRCGSEDKREEGDLGVVDRGEAARE